eukprot:11840662-Heterocapsa_arctica.AAC.1
MSTVTGEVCVAPGSGGLMGDRSEPDIFGSTFVKHIKHWQQGLYQEAPENRLLITRCPVTGQRTPTSRWLKVPVKPGAEQGKRLAEAAMKVSGMLTEQLEKGGFAQNVSKQVTTVKAAGMGGMAAERELLRGTIDMPGKVARTARYLGPWLHMRGAFCCEREEDCGCKDGLLAAGAVLVEQDTVDNEEACVHGQGHRSNH